MIEPIKVNETRFRSRRGTPYRVLYHPRGTILADRPVWEIEAWDGRWRQADVHVPEP